MNKFEGIVLVKQDVFSWKDTCYLYSVNLPSKNIKQCGFLFLAKEYVDLLLSRKITLDCLAPVYKKDYWIFKDIGNVEESKFVKGIEDTAAFGITNYVIRNFELPETLQIGLPAIKQHLDFLKLQFVEEYISYCEMKNTDIDNSKLKDSAHQSPDELLESIKKEILEFINSRKDD